MATTGRVDERVMAAVEALTSAGASSAQVQGNAAHDAADAGSPVKIGGKANAAAPTAVAENDRVDASFDLQGQLRTVGAAPHADDAAFTPGTSKVMPVGLLFDDTSPDSVDEGDAGIPRMSANRNAYATLRDAAGNERGANVTAANELLTADRPIACAAADLHAPAANTAAVVTYAAAGAGVYHVITGVAWSYDVDPTGGSLKIEDVSGTTVFHVTITAKGPGFFNFPQPKKSAAANTAMIITLAAGGSGVTGKVNVLNHWTE